MGVDWSLREGYAWAEDKEHCEEYGRMLQADPSKVSSKAKKRGLPQVHHNHLHHYYDHQHPHDRHAPLHHHYHHKYCCHQSMKQEFHFTFLK